MVRRECTGGNCSADCGGGCGCISSSDDPDDCHCKCYFSIFVTAKGGRRIPFRTFKPGIKVTPQSKFDICVKNLPIGALAEFLDKYLPNKIVVPARVATKKVTIRLKKKTFKQIINGSGLVLKGS